MGLDGTKTELDSTLLDDNKLDLLVGIALVDPILLDDVNLFVELVDVVFAKLLVYNLDDDINAELDLNWEDDIHAELDCTLEDDINAELDCT